MDARDDGEGLQWKTKLGAKERRASKRYAIARDAGGQHQAAGCVGVIDTRQPTVGREVKAERVAALGRKERRYVKTLCGAERLAVGKWRAIVVRQQIVVRFAERVVDFSDDRAHVAGRVAADPEADRLECIAQHSRKADDLDLAVGFDAMGTKKLMNPGVQ